LGFRLRCAGAALAALMMAAPAPHDPSPGEAEIRRALRAGKRAIELPAGLIEISSELEVPANAHDLEIRGAPAGTTLHASKNFHGRAIFTCESCRRIRFSGFTLDGNRAALEQRLGLPPYDRPFAQFTPGNGILALHAVTLAVSNVQFVNVPGFAILISGSRDVLIDRVRIEDSGSRNATGRNNATGGILFEEGTERFQVARSVLRNIRGNGVWTHSLYTSPRNADGRIFDNQFERIGRDAIQAGHATRVRVENNTGKLIGFPTEIVDIEGHGMPVAIDTAGNTDHSAYVRNSFEEINGKCIDLDGFHDGEVRANTCMNRYTAERYPYGHFGIVMNNSNPDMQAEGIEITDNTIDGTLFGGIFVIGTKNRIWHNRLRRINLAHCDGSSAKFGCNYSPNQPDLLRSGIYLGAGAERPAPARENIIEENQISGYGMSAHCVSAAPGVSLAANRIARNVCKDEAGR
jgi:hypothetical protein